MGGAGFHGIALSRGLPWRLSGREGSPPKALGEESSVHVPSDRAEWTVAWGGLATVRSMPSTWATTGRVGQYTTKLARSRLSRWT